MQKILVTGCCGFIGSHLVDELMRRGYFVVGLDNLSTGNIKNLEKAFDNPGLFKFIEGDIRDERAVAKAMKGMEYVLHTAALARIQPSIKEPKLYHDVNTRGTLNLLVEAQKRRVRKFVFSSSSSVYGRDADEPLSEDMLIHPGSPYAVGKAWAEMTCAMFSEVYRLPTICLRYFNVFGPRMIPSGSYAAVISIFIDQKKNDNPLTVVGDGEQRRDMTWIDDVVDANMRAMLSEETGIFNIGSGKNHSINEIAKMIGGQVEHLDKRQGEYRTTLADHSKATEKLGWMPQTSFEEGMAKIL